VHKPAGVYAPAPLRRPLRKLNRLGLWIGLDGSSSCDYGMCPASRLVRDRLNCLCYNPFVDYRAKEEATLVNHWTSGFQA
jgi:hypothetical protein